jgi:hypothetical protein
MGGIAARVIWCGGWEGTLKFRTLFERSLYDMMFRNQAAVKCVTPPPLVYHG